MQHFYPLAQIRVQTNNAWEEENRSLLKTLQQVKKLY